MKKDEERKNINEIFIKEIPQLKFFLQSIKESYCKTELLHIIQPVTNYYVKKQYA